MNESDVSSRVTEASEASTYAVRVEVQHPDAPWVNKVVIRLYVRDGSAEGVATAVREVASAAAADPDLKGTDLTFIAYEGRPEDNSRIDDLRVMRSVSAIVGGKGVEGILDLTAADIRRLAGDQ